MTPKIAIIGEGVIGCSTALQVAQAVPDARVTVLSDRPFEQTCSFGPAGLFRIDDIANREFGKSTFDWFAHLHRTEKGDKTGVKLLSGHIQSDSKERLEQQQKAYGDIVYNFRFLEKREILDLFPNPSEHCIHYTAFASEGNKYVPYLKFQCQARGVEFLHRKVRDLEEGEQCCNRLGEAGKPLGSGNYGCRPERYFGKIRCTASGYEGAKNLRGVVRAQTSSEDYSD
ncbi:FAD dependent oxidoreductase domain-containing protein [Caenorhabditis elegans]|uniref:FAD dependent oxidoreductase domain-containing protein n=1 Tax=Caenorhabditis elegans TaxID=6239 RepID=C8JQS2_CAEEL|nr:FAD dependent oxidoreductase domain-containing protein [Caenorhabditis elegans]CBB16923.1 FAD dependent oxidoreductase domain-containing protein [Caenorhabditis elegans]|eukprot:NP_001256758.1 D-aspartate oxidase 1 [Caenorhabditis elegans]